MSVIFTKRITDHCHHSNRHSGLAHSRNVVKTAIGSYRDDKKRYDSQHYHDTTRHQKNLPKFFKIVKFALILDAVTTSD